MGSVAGPVEDEEDLPRDKRGQAGEDHTAGVTDRTLSPTPTLESDSRVVPAQMLPSTDMCITETVGGRPHCAPARGHLASAQAVQGLKSRQHRGPIWPRGSQGVRVARTINACVSHRTLALPTVPL